MVKTLVIDQFTTLSGAEYEQLPVSYRVFGPDLHQAPIICINHALTGNANVSGETGWWRDLVGPDKAIDTQCFTVLAFDIPGNGANGFVIENYQDFTAKDMARLLLVALAQLGVNELHALIGASLGGGIAWEMIALAPKLCRHFIPVATDCESSDWLIANCHLQEQILLNSKQPVPDARKHAMMCYRTPQSFSRRFQRKKQANQPLFQVESWLNHHGDSLDKRFSLQAYLLMNQLLKTVDSGIRDNPKRAAQISAQIHLVAIDSDLFYPATDTRELFQWLKQHLGPRQVEYHEINSPHGHDAFLIEKQQTSHIMNLILNSKQRHQTSRVLKFGGQSLTDGNGGFNRVIKIIQSRLSKLQRTVVVLSARGDTTQRLHDLVHQAVSGEDYERALTTLIAQQTPPGLSIDWQENVDLINRLLKGIAMVGDYSLKTLDKVLAQGELMSVKAMAAALTGRGVRVALLDTRSLIKSDDNYSRASPLSQLSKTAVCHAVVALTDYDVILAAGFVASTEQGDTTTLGLNGSNYTAALLANFLDADELENYTHVDGIFTANPQWVEQAHKIEQLSFAEANELAQLGTSVLHAKTMIPLLEKNIPLRLLNTFNPTDEGTLISAQSNQTGIKCISAETDRALINLSGRGLLGKVGVDSRIFNALARHSISVNIIAQSGAERGVGLVVNRDDAQLAWRVLRDEFSDDIKRQDVSDICLDEQVSVITAVGLSLSDFSRPLTALVNNQITPLIMNNALSGHSVSLVVKQADLIKAVNVIHSAIFGALKRVHLVLFGHGVVGGALIAQILAAQETIKQGKNIDLKIIAIANSRQVLLDKDGISADWSSRLESSHQSSQLQTIVDYVRQHHLENVIAVDNTASLSLCGQYGELITAGFDLVSSNKIANTFDYDAYSRLHETLKRHDKVYLYETNVGAGLPLIDTIRTLHQSGENITAIRGIFSGSLSYIFNRFGEEDVAFSEVVKAAVGHGFTEPDPRQDLNGQDVARKLLILARELDLAVSMVDVVIENLIPNDLIKLTLADFKQRLRELDAVFAHKKAALKPGQVLRYVGELSGDLMHTNTAQLTVSLQAVDSNGPLGRVRGSDSLFEIFTESYGQQPMIIQGAGAGAQVTARGVLGDVLRIASQRTA
ncbi:aspartate kinase [Marinicella gelatinilytica]|uniref:aspartate kinase n=1 Tax=Marinicella gelatinilytica TaxID=2996017 RepID=UPI002260A4DC|nr:aspartate kinase [Marinicella gelatinilytica]MCX7545025.1 aspartate kinase [Marinicella gelatinilytica]